MDCTRLLPSRRESFVSRRKGTTTVRGSTMFETGRRCSSSDKGSAMKMK